MEFKTLQECLKEYTAPSGKEEDLFYWKNRCETSFNSDPHYRHLAISKTYGKKKEQIEEVLFKEDWSLVSRHFYLCLDAACQIPEAKTFLYNPLMQPGPNAGFPWVYVQAPGFRFYEEIYEKLGVENGRGELNLFLKLRAEQKNDFNQVFKLIAQNLGRVDSLQFSNFDKDGYVPHVDLRQTRKVWETLQK